MNRALPAGVATNVPSIMTAQEDPASIKRLADLILEKCPECVFTHDVCAMNVEPFTTALLATTAFWQAVDQGFRGALLHWREPHTRLGEFTTESALSVLVINAAFGRNQTLVYYRARIMRAR